MAEELIVRSLSKRFGGVKAVDSFDITVQRRKIHGLIGPNGAGKSTVLSLVSGFIVPDSGEITYRGQGLIGKRSSEIIRLGVGRTFQEPSPLKGLSVLSNVLVGLHSAGKAGFVQNLVRSPAARREEVVLDASARAILKEFGLHDRALDFAEDLSFGEQRFLEVARLAAAKPDILMLDEPAAGMGGSESKRLGSAILALRDQGKGILLVDHDMAFVFSICDEVTVMDAGRVIAVGSPLEIKESHEVRSAYLGDGGGGTASYDGVGD